MSESAFLQSCRKALGTQKKKPFSLTESALEYLKKKAAEEKAATVTSKPKKVTKLVIVPRPWFVHLIHRTSINWREFHVQFGTKSNEVHTGRKDTVSQPKRAPQPQEAKQASSGNGCAPVPTSVPEEPPVAVAVPFSSAPDRVRVVPMNWKEPEAPMRVQEFATSGTSISGIRDSVATPPMSKSMGVEFLKQDFQVFIRKYDCLSHLHLIYLKKWESDNNYFDNMLHDNNIVYSLQPGEQRRSEAPDGRKIIVTNTVWGPVVVFQTNVTDGSSPVAYVGPDELRSLNLLRGKSPLLSATDLEWVIGVDNHPNTDNIGKLSLRIESPSN